LNLIIHAVTGKETIETCIYCRISEPGFVAYTIVLSARKFEFFASSSSTNSNILHLFDDCPFIKQDGRDFSVTDIFQTKVATCDPGRTEDC
jgi:hypothetical protein